MSVLKRKISNLCTAGSRLLPENPLFRLLTINGLIGVFVSLMFLAGVFALNVGNLRHLVVQADNPVLPVAMLAFGLIITLTSVVMGTAVMMLKNPDVGGPGRGKRIRLEGYRQMELAPALVPVPVHKR